MQECIEALVEMSIMDTRVSVEHAMRQGTDEKFDTYIYIYIHILTFQQICNPTH